MVKNAYIHIPFCKSKCKYCSFVSISSLELKSSYLSALKCEIDKKYNGEELDTIYFGGGTPSLLDVSEVKAILSEFDFNDNTEITFEMNPEDADFEYLKALLNIGVNRLSIGVQTFDDDILELIGRRHSALKVDSAVDLAKKAGFKNISLDFIYGLPNQSLESFISDIKRAIELSVNHISLYGLKIEEGCEFFAKAPLDLPDDEVQAQMYKEVIKELDLLGFNRYEVSNFSKTGFESKHNLCYWKNKNYYGFGASASGYEKGVRYTNILGIKEYIQSPLGKYFEHKVTETEKLEEEIFLGLRLTEGLDVEDINNKFKINFDLKYKSILDKFIQSEHILKTEKGYKLSVEGVLSSNYVLAEFLEV